MHLNHLDNNKIGIVEELYRFFPEYKNQVDFEISDLPHLIYTDFMLNFCRSISGNINTSTDNLINFSKLMESLSLKTDEYSKDLIEVSIVEIMLDFPNETFIIFEVLDESTKNLFQSIIKKNNWQNRLKIKSFASVGFVTNC